MSSDKKQILVIKTSDNKKINVEADLFKKYSILVGNMMDTTIDDVVDKEEILLPFYNIKSTTMHRIVEFLNKFNP